MSEGVVVEHREILEGILDSVLGTIDLEAAAKEVGYDVLVDADGRPVTMKDVQFLANWRPPRNACGVFLRLSDGSEFTVAVDVHRMPGGGR